MPPLCLGFAHNVAFVATEDPGVAGRPADAVVRWLPSSLGKVRALVQPFKIPIAPSQPNANVIKVVKDVIELLLVTLVVSHLPAAGTSTPTE